MKKFVKLRIHKLILIMACAALLFSVHLGYSIITSNLDVDGNVKVKKGCEYDIGKEWYFETVGEHQFEIKCNGIYKLETWGAQGGSYNSTYYGGYGAYAVGNASISKSKILYINVGGKGNSVPVLPSDTFTVYGGYNGGNDAKGLWTGNVDAIQTKSTGGGATHIAYKSGQLKDLESYKGIYSNSFKTYNSQEILIVAAGGGASMYFQEPNNNNVYNAMAIGGHGGGYVGSSSTIVTSTQLSGISSINNATQTSPGNFCYRTTNCNTSAFGISGSAFGTGGGGWYGGYSGYFGGGGGTSYVGSSLLTNKAIYCYNCSESNIESIKTISTNNVSATATSNYAKSGNGYAKITLISYT